MPKSMSGRTLVPQPKVPKAWYVPATKLPGRWSKQGDATKPTPKAVTFRKWCVVREVYVYASSVPRGAKGWERC